MNLCRPHSLLRALGEGLFDGLACRTRVGTAPSNDASLDGGAAPDARFPVASEYGKTELMRPALSTCISVVGQGSAPVLNRLSKNGHDRFGNPAYSVIIDQGAGRRRVDPSQKERFVDVNVAETGDDALIKQDRLHWRSATDENALKVCDAEAVLRRVLQRNGFWAEAAQQMRERLGIRRESQSPELPLVCERDRATVVHRKQSPMMSRRRRVGFDDHDSPSHPEMDDECPADIEVQEQVFPSASDAKAPRPR